MFQIAEVNKAVGAVPQLVDRGFKVIFDKNMKTGQDMSLMLNKETNVAPRFRRERKCGSLMPTSIKMTRKGSEKPKVFTGGDERQCDSFKFHR